MLGLVWRGLAYMPGTDPNLPGYSDWGLAFRGFLKGSVGIVVGSAVLGAIIAGAFALAA